MARYLFRAARFLLMAAPTGILGPQLGGLLLAGLAAVAAISLNQEAKAEALIVANLAKMPVWLEAKRQRGGPTLSAWQKWLLIWGSWGWKSEPLLARAPFTPGRLIGGERSYMLVDEAGPVSMRDRLAVIGLFTVLAGLPLSIIAVGWLGGGWLGFQPSSPYRRAFDATLLLMIVSYWILTLLHERILLFTSVPASDPELEDLCRPVELRLSYLPQPSDRWLRGGLLDRPWRKAVLINAIDYERLARIELRALVAHEMVHLRQHHDLFFGVRLLWALTGAALVIWLLDFVGLRTNPLPNLPVPLALALVGGVVALGFFGLPYLKARFAERKAYLGAAAAVGAAPVLRLLQADAASHPGWVRDLMAELEAKALAEARQRIEGQRG